MTFLETHFNIKNKVIVITGAGGHLCGEMARGFARAGSSVAILDLRINKAKAIEDELRNEGIQHLLSLQIDVCNKNAHELALAKIVSEFGAVDVLINGAGINSPSPFFDITLEDWHNVFNSQLTGTLLGCQVFGHHMVNNGKGSIINISSASAGPPLSKAFSYSAAKAGILNLTQNLGREWGQSGVRVNAIRPGFFPTDWNRKHFITPDREKAILNHTPMARYGDPSELLGALFWLASDSSSFVTGAEIAIDGGFSCMTI